VSWRCSMGARLPLMLVLPVVGACSAADAAPAHARLTPVPITSVELTDGFWAPRLETLRDVTIAHEIRMCEETGRLRNFRIAAGLEEGQFEGIYFNDSDVYKVIEGASYLYALEKDPARRARIAAQIDPIIDDIAKAQQPDGYIYTFYTLTDPSKRWSDLPSMHELYCQGHLIEGAVAHYRATGSRKFLDVAIRCADYIDSVFGPGKNPGVCGHEEIELALVKLADATGDEKYFRLAEHFVNQRGTNHGPEYDQDHMPVREQRSVVGHAVRAMYLFCAAADVAARTGDEGLRAAANAIWDDLTGKKMYVTSGIGPSGSNEGFTTEYDLPNDTAYAETCAAIGLALYGNRMVQLEGNSRFADDVERALYNGALSGISLSGDRFFYVNPLGSQGGHHREPWFGCACCPPNILRVIPQVPGMIYSTAPDGLYVNLYAQNRASVEVEGHTVAVEMKTGYPWDGRVEITVKPDVPAEFDLCLRKPGWCNDWTISVNGGEQRATVGADGYIRLRRKWTGQTVTLDLAMPVERIEATPMVKADLGRVALQRGPIIYCLEGVDNGESVRDLYLPREAKLTAEYDGKLLGGVVKVTGNARRAVGAWEGQLYRSGALGPEAPITAIPYYAWDNRAAGQMLVWLPESAGLTEPRLPEGLANSATVSASYEHQNVQAVRDRKIPLSSSEISFDWWPHQGTEEWLCYTWEKPVDVGGVDVYWFDDTGTGGCKVPASWVVEWNDAGTWREVESVSGYGAQPNAFNPLSFRPVKTKELRLRVKLQEGFSGGVCEWRVLPAR
jgi:uncharacterized protein